MMMKTVINVAGMSCGHCVKAVHDALYNKEGVSCVEVDLEKNIAEVDFDETRVSLEELENEIEEVGFDVVRE